MNRLFNRILDHIAMINFYIMLLDAEFIKSNSLESRNQCVSLQKIYNDFHKIFLDECYNFSMQKEYNFSSVAENFNAIEKKLPALLSQANLDHLKDIDDILIDISQFIKNFSHQKFLQDFTLEDLRKIKKEITHIRYEER